MWYLSLVATSRPLPSILAFFISSIFLISNLFTEASDTQIEFRAKNFFYSFYAKIGFFVPQQPSKLLPFLPSSSFMET